MSTLSQSLSKQTWPRDLWGKSLARFAIISSAFQTPRVSSRCLADKIRFLVTYCYSSIISVNKWISVSRLLATTQEHKFLMQNWSMSDSLRRINHGRSMQRNMPLVDWFRCVFYQTCELSFPLKQETWCTAKAGRNTPRRELIIDRCMMLTGVSNAVGLIRKWT